MDKLDCILQFGPINSGSSEKTLMCIGKLMAHTLFLNRAGIYRSKLQNAVQLSLAKFSCMLPILSMLDAFDQQTEKTTLQNKDFSDRGVE